MCIRNYDSIDMGCLNTTVDQAPRNLTRRAYMKKKKNCGLIQLQVCYTADLSAEEVLELCAVGDLTLLLNAVKVLGTILYCKQSFTQCGQPLASSE